MASKDKKPRPERTQTDESLRLERQETDKELGKQQGAIEEYADEVVRRARSKADEVLQAARTKADQKLKQSGGISGQARKSLAQERAQEDRTLQRERVTADEGLRDEREARQRALASLLSMEREQTDKHLMIERARLDEVVTSRDDFLAMVSHDLRTLLGGIALNAAILDRTASDDEVGKKNRRVAENIKRFTAQINRLVGDLLDVASIEAGKLMIAPRQDDAVRLVRDSVEAFLPAASAKGISLHAEVAESSLLAELDYERILQVLANLLSNALKFTSEGGSVSIRVEPAGKEVRFSVADTGSGIPADKLEAIFDRFWQVGQKDRRGLGLGLYISRCIVEAHGGRIWAESERGKGSTIHFTLPGERASDEGEG